MTRVELAKLWVVDIEPRYIQAIVGVEMASDRPRRVPDQDFGVQGADERCRRESTVAVPEPKVLDEQASWKGIEQ